MFTSVPTLIDHKKNYCKLRFTCKCDMTNEGPNGNGEPCLNGSVCGGNKGNPAEDNAQGGEGEQGGVLLVDLKDKFYIGRSF